MLLCPNLPEVLIFTRGRCMPHVKRQESGPDHTDIPLPQHRLWNTDSPAELSHHLHGDQQTPYF